MRHAKSVTIFHPIDNHKEGLHALAPFQPSEIVIRGISLGRLEQSVRVRNISGAISQIRDRHIAGLPLPLSGKLGGISP